VHIVNKIVIVTDNAVYNTVQIVMYVRGIFVFCHECRPVYCR